MRGRGGELLKEIRHGSGAKILYSGLKKQNTHVDVVKILYLGPNKQKTLVVIELKIKQNIIKR